MRSTRVSAGVPDKGHVECGRGDRKRSAYDQSTIILREAVGDRDQQLDCLTRSIPAKKLGTETMMLRVIPDTASCASTEP